MSPVALEMAHCEWSGLVASLGPPVDPQAAEAQAGKAAEQLRGFKNKVTSQQLKPAKLPPSSF